MAWSLTTVGQAFLYDVGPTASTDYWNGTYPKAALQFETGPTPTIISDFQLHGRRSSGVGGNVVFHIYDDNANQPGTSVGTLSSLAASSLPTTASYFGASGLNYNLAPNTTYWLVADFSAVSFGLGDVIRLSRAFSGSNTTATSYKFTTLGQTGWAPGSGFLAGSITAVPEPEEYAAVAAASLIGFGLWRRARRCA